MTSVIQKKTPKPTSISLQPDIKERLKKFAESQQRSMTFVIEVLVTEALDAREGKAKNENQSV